METTRISHSKNENLKNQSSALAAKYFPEEGSGRRPLSATIYKKTVSEVFDLLRNVENFPQFFESLKKVETAGEGKAQWYFQGIPSEGFSSHDSFSVPMNVQFDQSNNSLVWKAEDKAGFDYTIAIELLPAPADRGTIVRLMVAYENMLGEIAGKFEKIFGKDAEVTSKKNLQRLKAFCETGSVPTTEGQPSGREEDLEETKH
ncbi:hypothetical protein AZI86_13255 [Bdellovibrio bacteriovorus]|uniref:Ribosome association toxin RatA n=1 Tax=Bdellovibrio bacteriovorus TaxID=959 RepID=A0A150WJN3_BDEBC|nr:hypothetical protein [Bdellovibrio bacteriovorus]KYG63785.1 hypothetical protein AZI86_13255 [Bdellovibrio bacteriovorus]